MNVPIEILIAALGVAASAGAALFALRHAVKQVNGLGRKYNRMEKALMAFCPTEQREKIAEFLKI